MLNESHFGMEGVVGSMQLITIGIRLFAECQIVTSQKIHQNKSLAKNNFKTFSSLSSNRSRIFFRPKSVSAFRCPTPKSIAVTSLSFSHPACCAACRPTAAHARSTPRSPPRVVDRRRESRRPPLSLFFLSLFISSSLFPLFLFLSFFFSLLISRFFFLLCLHTP